ncbi:winged helix-turn-helix domain-containing protein [Aeromonas sp. HMWF016]|uniref:winged helix-turn-helix domain-containing protein n=1 Tax=Aeromonas sp. HMWF016 TaxID=2056852 RepID=UPI000D380F8E|nr:winged helix-turn-helix domain-containing protein [Aeromonas sp. HMWF016]PTT45931.1 hypothetical protein DBR09_13365 [Aeromonas sp. HMWF016]
MSDVLHKKVLVDRKSGYVYHGDINIGQLNDNELRIFIMLLDAKGEVLSKEHLLEMGWPGRVVVPNSLNMAIRKIRSILNEFNDEILIQTVARQGFRIITEVVGIVDSSEVKPHYYNNEEQVVDESGGVKYPYQVRASNKVVFIFTLLVILFVFFVVNFIHGESISLQCHQENGVWLCGLDSDDSTNKKTITCKPSGLKCLEASEKEVYIYGSVSDKKDIDSIKVK